jgi:hypothetical protein
MLGLLTSLQVKQTASSSTQSLVLSLSAPNAQEQVIRQMESAQTYEEWFALAKELDMQVPDMCQSSSKQHHG